MNLKILVILLMYYSVLTMVFVFGGEYFNESDGYTQEFNLNSQELQDTEVDTGGLFGTGISFARFTGLISVGIGLPSGIASWFKLLFAVWQTGFLIFSIGFVIDSIWGG